MEPSMGTDSLAAVAAQVERAILTEIGSPPAPAASAPPPAEASRSNNLGLRGGANSGANSDRKY